MIPAAAQAMDGGLHHLGRLELFPAVGIDHDGSRGLGDEGGGDIDEPLWDVLVSQFQ